MQHSSRQIFGFLLGAVIVVGGSIYLYTQLETFLGGPSITITNPQKSSSTVDSELINISGTALNVASLTLNGNSIAVDQNNSFNEVLLLAPGFNIIEVRARDRFGKEYTLTRAIIYQTQDTDISLRSNQEQVSTTTLEQSIP